MVDWVRFGYDLGSSGLNAAETGSGNNISVANVASVDLLWKSPILDGKVWSQIVIVGSYAYVTTRGGTFYKLNATTGAVVASFAIGSPSSSTPHIIGGIAYFGADNGYLYAVTVSTMAQLWRSTVQDSAAVLSHPVVSGTRVFYGTSSAQVRAALIADGTQSWSVSIASAGGGAVLGALAVWASKLYVAGPLGAYEFTLAGTAGKIYGARAQTYGVAIQTHTNGTDFLCFESEDHWTYAYNRSTGTRLWMEGHQGGDQKCPVGLDLTRVGMFGTGFVVVGTHNWSIQPHAAEGGDMIWKRDSSPSPAPSAAIQAGFAIANGIFVGVWPPNDGRVAAFLLDQGRGGHTANWKYGTDTGNQGSGSSLNKFFLGAPSIVNGRIYCGADDKYAYCFA